MYQNYIFDLYGTLVDIQTNEKKAYLWKKMSLFFGMKGAAYEPKELRTAYETKIKEQEAALRTECHGSHVPEIDIANVCHFIANLHPFQFCVSVFVPV